MRPKKLIGSIVCWIRKKHDLGKREYFFITVNLPKNLNYSDALDAMGQSLLAKHKGAVLERHDDRWGFYAYGCRCNTCGKIFGEK
ncbi:MAG: hypothetical protein UV65_C0002G0012 [Parcubacteria group bacterium GW2011_GWF2_43_11]|nr:MAG: hypothetical protein UV65_C0002G0012 [Parcubacteria group bacterium GW2011_GWF2_43_11]